MSDEKKTIVQAFVQAWCSDETPCSRLTTLQARGDRLAGYAVHDINCGYHPEKVARKWQDVVCTCGLTEALTEWRKGC